MTDNDIFKSKLIKNCYACGGDGMCAWCKGSAKCDGCKGTGSVDGNIKGSEIKCPICQGNGVCAQCLVTGRCIKCVVYPYLEKIKKEVMPPKQTPKFKSGDQVKFKVTRLGEPKKIGTVIKQNIDQMQYSGSEVYVVKFPDGKKECPKYVLEKVENTPIITETQASLCREEREFTIWNNKGQNIRVDISTIISMYSQLHDPKWTPAKDTILIDYNIFRVLPENILTAEVPDSDLELIIVLNKFEKQFYECPNCHTASRMIHKFCYNCGTKIKKEKKGKNGLATDEKLHLWAKKEEPKIVNPNNPQDIEITELEVGDTVKNRSEQFKHYGYDIIAIVDTESLSYKFDVVWQSGNKSKNFLSKLIKVEPEVGNHIKVINLNESFEEGILIGSIGKIKTFTESRARNHRFEERRFEIEFADGEFTTLWRDNFELSSNNITKSNIPPNKIPDWNKVIECEGKNHSHTVCNECILRPPGSPECLADKLYFPDRHYFFYNPNNPLIYELGHLFNDCELIREEFEGPETRMLVHIGALIQERIDELEENNKQTNEVDENDTKTR